jgi:hypothetical protein
VFHDKTGTMNKEKDFSEEPDGVRRPRFRCGLPQKTALNCALFLNEFISHTYNSAMKCDEQEGQIQQQPRQGDRRLPHNHSSSGVSPAQSTKLSLIKPNEA